MVAEQCTLLRTLKSNVCMKTLVAELRDSSAFSVSVDSWKLLVTKIVTIFGDCVSEIS